MAQALNARNAPQLLFRHDQLSASEAQLEDAFRRIEVERALSRLSGLSERGREVQETAVRSPQQLGTANQKQTKGSENQ